MSQPETGHRSVDRNTLYEELWQIPGTQLARKYGVSDVAIGKACRRHDIPRPPPGYWTMRNYGYEVERTPLPAIADPRLEKVEFHPQPTLPSLVNDDATSEAASPAHPARAPIKVSDHLSAPHALVEEARKQLRSATSDDSRVVRTNAETALNISVALASITRTLNIMNRPSDSNRLSAEIRDRSQGPIEVSCFNSETARVWDRGPFEAVEGHEL